MQHYTLPGFWEQQSTIIPFLNLYKNYQYLFRENIIIDSVYGNFRHTIWDGGRHEINTDIPYANFDDIINFQNIYNNILNIPVRFIFTNCLLEQKHCYNEFCNFILDTFQYYNNQITINSTILETYIRNKYNNYSFISSVTKNLSQIEYIKELKQNKYQLVCLPSKFNKNIEFLYNTIPTDLRSKCELIVNTKCPLTCISAKQHQIADSYANLHLIAPIYNFPCARNFKSNELLNSAKLNLNILNQYEEKGYYNFKLIERIFLENPLELINTLIYYLIKTEYKQQVKDYLIYYKNNWNIINLNNFNLNQFIFKI